MKGTDKQIAWAEDIKATYLEMMEKETAWLKAVIEAGSIRSAKKDATVATFVRVYHPETTYNSVKSEMMESDLYKAYAAVEGEERKAAGKAFRSAVAKEALGRLEKAVAEKAAEESAAEWIETRMR